MKKVLTLFFLVFSVTNSAVAQYVEWENLFRIYKAPNAAKENAVLDLGFDFDRTFTNTATQKLCYNFKRVMMGNEGEWDEFISYCKDGTVVTYKTENSTQFQRLKRELADKYGFTESQKDGTVEGGLKTVLVSTGSKIQFYSNKDKAGKANNIIAIVALVDASAQQPVADNSSPQSKKANSKPGRGVEVAEADISNSTVGKFHALIIGVQEYADPFIKDLDQPVNDARLLFTTLTQYYTFDTKNVSLLVNPKRNEVMKALDNLSNTIEPTDNLIIFYAGHGYWDDRIDQGYWWLSDAHKSDKSEWLSNSSLKDYIRGIKSKHTLLITDACFSGGIFKTRGESVENSRAIRATYNLPSRKALTSGTKNEAVPDKSVFMEFLLKRLVENKEKYLIAEDLFSSFRSAVINNSPNAQVPQFGEIRETGDEGGDFIFIRK